MNYAKNNKRRLIAFTKTSIVFATVSPIIINSDSTEAMFKSPVKNPTSPKEGSVQSIINRFEGILSNNISSTLAPSQNIKPKLLPKPISISGIKYPYKEPSSKISNADTSGMQSPSTKPKVRFSSNVEVRFFDPNDEQAPKANPPLPPKPQHLKITNSPSINQKQNNKSSSNKDLKISNADVNFTTTKSKTKPPLPPKPQFNLKITNSPSENQKPINISEKRIKELEVLFKGNVAAIVKENLPENFKASGPITIDFDEASGQEFNVALSKFIYATTQNTLSSLSKKQN